MTKKTLLSVLCIFLALFSCKNKTKPGATDLTNANFPAELIEFQPYESNPVFKGTGTNTWDKLIRERGYILIEDGVWKLWYTGYNPEITDQKFLGLATSADGITWTRYSDAPVFSGRWTEDMFVVKNDGIYYMYAEGVNDVAHLLISNDGIHWQDQGDLSIRLADGDSIPGPYGTPSVWIENGDWYLFYERNDAGVWLAKSTDKIHWQNILDEPVLKPGPDNYDTGAVAADQVIKYGDRYYMYYHATSDPDWENPSPSIEWTSNVAMSDDLIRWVKYKGNPVVEGDHSSPVLVFDGEKPFLYTMHPEVWRYTSK